MSIPSPRTPSLFRSSLIVGSLTLVSRLFGFIRDLLVARLFGGSGYADCFFVAFRIPNLLRSFVAEGALTAAFVPLFAEDLRRGPEQAQRTLATITGFLVTVTGALAIAGIIFTPYLVTFMAPGFERSPQLFDLCILLTRVMLPYILFVSLVAMLNGALNSVHVFGAAAMAQVLMNLSLIVGAIVATYFEEYTATIVLAISVLLGGIIQVIAQLPALTRGGLRFECRFHLRSTTVRNLVTLMLPALLGATVYQISQFVNTLFATLLGTGAVSWLFYADRLTQLPIGIFSIALASVLLPTLSRAQAENDHSQFARSLEDSLRFTTFCIPPIALFLALYAEPLIRWMFERGAFTAEDTAQTAAAVKMFAIGLWGVSCHSMVARAFIARKDTITPTLVGACTLVLNLVLALLLMGPVEVITDSEVGLFVAAVQYQIRALLPAFAFAHAGLALATSISTTIGCIVLAYLLSRRVSGIQWRTLARCAIHTVGALAATLLSVALLARYLPPASILGLILQMSLVVLIYPLSGLLMGSREAREIVKILKTRLKS